MNTSFKCAFDLDARLKAATPSANSPNGLHEDIMLAVGATSVSRPEPAHHRARLFSVVGCATAAIGLACWFALRPSSEFHALNVPAVALEQSQLLAQNAPATALTPLSSELDSLKRDLNGAVEFVIASLP
jgi:hypothetical protein